MGVSVTRGEEAGFRFVNLTGLPDERAREAIRETAATLVKWQKAVTSAPTMFDRTAYDFPDNQYDLFAVAESAVRSDDVVSGLCDLTSALAFQGVKWESVNPDEANVFNQISENLGIDVHLRTIWRELFTYSQVVLAEWWEPGSYTVKANPLLTKGRKRRKSYNVVGPTGWMLLDPMKIVPVGNRLFGNDPIAWRASEEEYEAWLNGTDLVLGTLFPAKYEPSGNDERERLGAWGVDYDRLLLADPAYVNRYTVPRPHYKPFADLKLASLFPLLDLKVQLMKADRVSLVGSANYLLVVKKGTKEEPAQQVEIDNLRQNFKVVASVPVIISDHRLSVEIVTPSQDRTLMEDRYRTIDNKIAANVLGYYDVSGKSSGSGASAEVNSRMIALHMENVRYMMKRFVEVRVGNAILERNPGVFSTTPTLAYAPRKVVIDPNANVLRMIMDLRAKNEISRETTLESIGLDQEVEAVRRVNEEEFMDSVFETAVPFASPDLPRPGQPAQNPPDQSTEDQEASDG